MRNRITLTVVEYGEPSPIVGPLANAMRISTGEAEAMLRRNGERLQRRHGLPTNPFEISNAGVTSKGVAGIVALSPRVELEIRPKFAGPSHDWRADLIFLALTTRHGHVDNTASIASMISRENNIADLVARAIIRSIERNRRSPLRLRRRLTKESFEPDGEIEPDALVNPGGEGWVQSAYAMTRDNEFWATIHRGAVTLLPSVRNVEIASRLMETVTRWGRPTSEPSRFRRMLPPRLACWQPAYDLCFEIAQGASLAPGAGHQLTFEFTLDMWRAWETLIERGLIAAFGADHVGLQSEIKLGSVEKAGRKSAIIVRPDAIVKASKATVVDAKYKGRNDRGPESVSAADRYEAIAFMLATRAEEIVLIYPKTDGTAVGSPAEIRQTENLPTGRLTAIAVGTAGLSQPQGLKRFTESLADSISAAISMHSVP